MERKLGEDNTVKPIGAWPDKRFRGSASPSSTFRGHLKQPAALRGLALASAVAGCAAMLGQRAPLVGAPVFAIVLGAALANLLGRHKELIEVSEISKLALKGGIVLLGAGLDLRQVLRTGATSAPILICTIFAGLAAAFATGARAGVSWRLRCLIGIGTTICGASAIAALAPVVKAKADEIAYSISVVFLLNMVAVILFPFLGHLLSLSDHGFGLWAGTAINDTSAVVAAGFAYSHAAGTYATIVKLTRTTLIVPMVLGFGLLSRRMEPEAYLQDTSLWFRVWRSIPWFIGLFLAAALLNTFGVINRFAADTELLGRSILLLALAAVGLQAHWRSFCKAGLAPVALGVLTWAAVAGTSLAVQTWMGRL